MGSLTPLIIQAGIIITLLYLSDQFPKFDTNLDTLHSALTNQSTIFSFEHKETPTPPIQQPSEPTEAKPKPSKPDDTPTPKPPKPDIRTPQNPEPTELPTKNIEDSELKSFPTAEGKKPEAFSQRKNQRRANLCKITGEGCVRYSPTEELKYFWIICALYTPNQANIEQLYQLHRNFLNYVKLYGINTQAIEVVFPGQEYQITKPNNEPYELQYTADWIFNMRENLVNVGSKKLPSDWQYIAWIDAHIFFDENRYWFEDLIVELHRNNIVHMMGSNDFYNERNVSIFHEEGMAKLWLQLHTHLLPPIRQCGMAWATRRDIFEGTHGLLDVCIGTKCDLYQNYAYIGMTFTEECTNPQYAEAVRKWQENAIGVFQNKVGFVKGNIIHFQHCGKGCKTSNYDGMTKALMRNNFNPNTDMQRDDEGRMQFKSNWQLAKDLWVIYGGDYRYL